MHKGNNLPRPLGYALRSHERGRSGCAGPAQPKLSGATMKRKRPSARRSNVHPLAARRSCRQFASSPYSRVHACSLKADQRCVKTCQRATSRRVENASPPALGSSVASTRPTRSCESAERRKSRGSGRGPSRSKRGLVSLLLPSNSESKDSELLNCGGAGS